jgi:hypothetical protein
MLLRAKQLVQTQEAGLHNAFVNPAFSMRFTTPSDCRRAIVVDSVAVSIGLHP